MLYYWCFIVKRIYARSLRVCRICGAVKRIDRIATKVVSSEKIITMVMETEVRFSDFVYSPGKTRRLLQKLMPPLEQSPVVFTAAH